MNTTDDTNTADRGSELSERLGAGSEARKTMRLHRVEYVEAPCPEQQHPIDGVCHYCALHLTDACADAANGAAEEAFGGDCETRDVVYARA